MACLDKKWSFDKYVAKSFAQHVRAHIPHYDSVVEKTLWLLENNLDRHSAICEVGCSNGMALELFMQAGFTNLIGVDSSEDMISSIPVHVKEHCQIIHSNEFPARTCPYDAVVCNWTLHFIQNKLSYLEQISNNLTQGGILILSEKTSLDEDMIRFYHKWKNKNGVDWEEINNKQRALEGVMHINSQNWYLETLSRLGFSTRIIDADWVFTTFYAVKQG